VLPDEVTKLIPPPKKVDVPVVEAKIPEDPANESVYDGDDVPIPNAPVVKALGEVVSDA
jgi:hypothetical protein